MAFPLCEACQTIPFRELQEHPEQKMKNVSLGLYKEIRAREASCGFCALVLRGMGDIAVWMGYGDNVDEHRQREAFDNQIQIVWRDGVLEAETYPFRFTSGQSPSLGRILNPTRLLDVDPLIGELARCDASHRCGLIMSDKDASRLAGFLRAIDVHRMCVTPIRLDAPYVALSYVWGNKSVPRLWRHNREALMMSGGLRTCYDSIPRTIRDAIDLVRRMGLDYLWVDALCLVQDDREEMAAGIDAMAAVYEHAHFTVVAAGGTDADFGLPGISPRTSVQVSGEVLPGIELVGIPQVGDLLEVMYYNKRAWTFQEFHLSRRKLIFLNDMVYYQCIERSWSEDVVGRPIESRIGNRVLETTTKVSEELLLEFRIILMEYAIRQATYNYDIINAVASVYNKMLGPVYGGHFFGVPVAVFDCFLPFYVIETNFRYLERREGVPSWAWTGWKGELRWVCKKLDSEALLWIAECTWIVWYAYDPAGNMGTIWDLVPDRGVNPPLSPTVQVNQKLENQRRFDTSVLPTLPARIVSSTVKQQPGLLRFWTFSAQFKVRADRVGDEYLRSLQFDNYKVWHEAFGPDKKYYGYIQVDEESSMNEDDDTAELIVISKLADFISRDYDPFYTNKHLLDLWKRKEGGCWYNVLYVQDRSGVVERKGLGQIYCDPIRVSPESWWAWKEFIMA